MCLLASYLAVSLLSHCLLLPLWQAAKRGHMTKNGAKGDYTWERLLAKIYTPQQLEEMDQAQFDAAKSGEIKRLEEGVRLVTSACSSSCTRLRAPSAFTQH